MDKWVPGRVVACTSISTSVANRGGMFLQTCRQTAATILVVEEYRRLEPSHHYCDWAGEYLNHAFQLSIPYQISHYWILYAKNASQIKGELEPIITDSFLCTELPQPPRIYKLAEPCDSKGRISTKRPAAMKSAPLVYTGAAVCKFANIATMG